MLGLALGLALGYVYVRWRSRPQVRLWANYRVYGPGERLPSQDDLMRLLAGRLEPGDLLLFSDVRLHVGLVRRERNPHLFRPDLLEGAELGAEELHAVSDARSCVNLRFHSEEPMKERRYLRFLVHAALGYAELGGGTLVYDAAARRVYTVEALRRLADAHDLTGPDAHVRVEWRDEGEGPVAATHGLVKVGLPEVETREASPDAEVALRAALESLVDRLWTAGRFGPEETVEAFGAPFRFRFERPRKDVVRARVFRGVAL